MINIMKGEDTAKKEELIEPIICNNDPIEE